MPSFFCNLQLLLKLSNTGSNVADQTADQLPDPKESRKQYENELRKQMELKKQREVEEKQKVLDEEQKLERRIREQQVWTSTYKTLLHFMNLFCSSQLRPLPLNAFAKSLAL